MTLDSVQPGTARKKRVLWKEHMELPIGWSFQLYCFLEFSNCGGDWVLHAAWSLIKIRPLISGEMKNWEFWHGKHFTFPLELWELDWVVASCFWWFDDTIHFKQYPSPPFIALRNSSGHHCLIWKTQWLPGLALLCYNTYIKGFKYLNADIMEGFL